MMPSVIQALFFLIHSASAGTDSIPIDRLREQKIDKMFVEYQNGFSDTPFITAQDLILLKRNTKPVVVDVRTLVERQISIIPDSISEAEFETNTGRYKNLTVIAYCTIGYRSGLYVKKLREKGFDAFNLKGGVLAWAHARQIFVDFHGKKTNQVHVYGQKWDLLPSEYKAFW